MSFFCFHAITELRSVLHRALSSTEIKNAGIIHHNLPFVLSCHSPSRARSNSSEVAPTPLPWNLPDSNMPSPPRKMCLVRRNGAIAWALVADSTHHVMPRFRSFSPFSTPSYHFSFLHPLV